MKFIKNYIEHKIYKREKVGVYSFALTSTIKNHCDTISKLLKLT